MAPGDFTSELLSAWDQLRQRSLQTELGMSQIGGCRRAVGYHLAGTPREESGTSLTAVIGTAVHEVFATQVEAMVDSGELPAGTLAEHEVRFGGVLGHLDMYQPRNGCPSFVLDLKTVRDKAAIEAHRATGPPQRHVWQVSMYAAGLMMQGYPVDECKLAYLGRADGACWTWSGKFDVEVVREAMAWLRTVRETDVDVLARDYRPESPQCQSCPYRQRCWEGHAVPDRDLRSALFADDPDAALWAKRLTDARERRKQAEADEADAKGALDALRPNDSGKADVEVPGLDKVIRFSVQRGRTRMDSARVKEDYARVGAQPPTVTGDPVITISLAAKEEG